MEADKGDLNAERSIPEVEDEAEAEAGTEAAGDTAVENTDNEALNTNDGGVGAGVETQEFENNEVVPAQTKADEQELDENGHQFITAPNGTTDFGRIGEETGLKEAPIKLSEGVITNHKTNAGYGLVHIEARHGNEIRNAGYGSVIEFVQDIAENFEKIREGANRHGEQTYLLQLTDSHNNTLIVELSKDGEYWNINTAGIFKSSYAQDRKIVYDRQATANQSAEIGEGTPTVEQSDTQTDARPVPSTRDKGTQVSEENKVRLPENPVASKWAALVEANEGDEAEALDTAMQMVGNKMAELEQARKTVTKGKTEEAIQEAKRAKREKVSALETELQFWKDVAGYPEKRRASEAQAAELNARLERERKRREQQASNPNYGLRQTEADDRLGAPLSLREYVIRKIATGRVKFLWSGSESGTGGLKEHGGAAKRQMLYTDKTRGQYPEDVAEAMRLDIADNYPEFGQVEASDILAEIENLAVGEQTPSEMMEEAERLHERSRRAGTDTEAEDAAREEAAIEEARAEQARASVAELTPEEYSSVHHVAPRFAGDMFDETGRPKAEAEEAMDEALAVVEAEAQVDTNPTDGQKEAGNYRKGHVRVNGLDITIENPKGSVRSGVDGDGKPWRTVMHNTYGYIRGTEGVDGDHIDVFLSDNPYSGEVFVVDQVNPQTGAFDEHKVMMGFDSEEEARRAYLSNYSDGWQGLGNITRVSQEDFRKWLDSSHRKTKPFAEYKIAGVDEAVPFQRVSVDVSPLATERQAKAIANQLKKLGLKGEVRIVDGVAELVKEARARLQSVFHGSGADFEAFDFSRMGSGEGNQAYGWGGYVTEVEGIGRTYAEQVTRNGKTLYAHAGNTSDYTKLSEPQLRRLEEFIEKTILSYNQLPQGASVRVDLKSGKVFLDKSGSSRTALLNYFKNVNQESIIAAFRLIDERLADKISEKGIFETGKDSDNRFDDFLTLVEEGLNVRLNQFLNEDRLIYFMSNLFLRNLYHVDIPTEQDGNYLRWEEPASDEQIEKILSYLGENYTSSNINFKDYIEEVKGLPNASNTNAWKRLGENVYNALILLLGDAKSVSEALSEAGFVGISYPAQYRSGGRADNARNYVIFKESDMKITDHIRYEQDASGEIAGATLPNGDVLLNRGAMRIDTPFHEFAHKLFTYAKGNRSAGRLYEAIRRYAQEAPQAVKDYVGARYPDLKDDAYLDEVFAWALSRQSEGGLEAFLKERGIGVDDTASRTWYERVWEAVKSLWAEVRPKVSRLLGRDFADLSVFDAYEEMGAEETGKALYDLMMGGKRLPGEEKTAEGTDSRAQMGSAEEAEIERRAKADGTWLKAPNGKPTKLTPKQWVQVRTKAFKDWFGDWELAENVRSGIDALRRISSGEESVRNAMVRNELQSFGGTAGITFDWGEEGKIGPDGHISGGFGFAKILQKHGVEDAIRIVGTIANGKIGKPYGPKDGQRVDIISGEYQTTISLFRNKESESWVLTGYKIDPNTDAKGRGSDLSNATQINPIRTREDLGAALRSDANIQYFDDLIANSSKVVDENGEPLVVYHGTRRTNPDGSSFTIFKEGRFSFFSDNMEVANQYGGMYNEKEEWKGKVYECYLDIHKPLIVDANNATWERIKFQGKFMDTVDISRYAYANGYDGVIIQNIYEGDIKGNNYISMRPSQIKSATDNVGTFDAGNPDIRYRFAGDMFAEDGRTKATGNGLHSLGKSVSLGERNGNYHEVLESGAQGELRGRDGLPRQAAQGERERGDSASRADARGIRSAIAGKSRAEARRIAVKWAKENGLWYDYTALSFGMPFKSGNENDTYLSADGKTVYKINNLLNNGGDLAAFLDGIEAHNALFPETSYEFVGFAGFDNDNAYPIFKQKFVPGASFATETEISDYMSSIGFRPTGNDAEFTNGEYIVKDIRPRNVLKDTNGFIHVIDAGFTRSSGAAAAKTSLEAKRQAALDAGASLGVPIVVEETPAGGRRRAKDEALGWFDTRTGAVHVNPDNHADAEDVKRTVMHEAVGHMGMRRLLEGKLPGAYDAFLDRVHAAMPAEAQAYFLDYARRSKAGRPLTEAELNRIAADEYVAALAEVGGDPNVWQRVVAEVRALLRRIGFDLDLSEADIRALLYESKHNLEGAAYYAEREMMRREQKEYRDEANLSNRLDEDRREAMREDFTKLTDESKAMKRAAIDQTEPIEVTSGVIKAKDGKRPIEVAIEYMRPSLPTLVKTDVGNIGIDEQSIRASLSHGFSQKKLDATTSLTKGMERAVYLGSAKDLDGKDLDNHYFAYPINYDGERNYVFCRAREDGNTNRLYVHEVFLSDELKKGVGHQTGVLADASQRRGNTLYKNILSDILNAKIDNTAESSKPDADVLYRMRRAGTSRDGRLGVISIDADSNGRYGAWTRQGLFKRASDVARYFLDDSLPLRHMMTHIKRSVGGVVTDATDLWRQKTMVVSRARIIVW